VSLATPPKVQKLQTTLHAKAKGSPGYRFYRLYDKVYRADILEFAYLRCRSNDGTSGVDGQTFADIEAYGRDRWLDELTTSSRGQPREVPAPSVASGEAQAVESGGITTSRSVPARRAGTGPLDRSNQSLPWAKA
jgi:hypothetical protein